MKKLHFALGLTLLEVMVSLVIFSMLLTALFYVYSIAAQSWLKVRQQIEVKDSARITLTRIEREIRASSIISVLIENYPVSTDPNTNDISFLTSINEYS